MSRLSRIRRFFKNERGATAVEYGLIAALIATVLITAISTVGTEINDTMTHVGNTLDTAQGN